MSKFISRKYKILLFVAPVIIFFDYWTKALILEHFRLGELLPVISGFFDITYVRNTGAAFGFLADSHPGFREPFFLAVPMIALVVIGMYFRKLPEKSIQVSLALSLIIGGAIGNLIDRARFGFVIDFLLFHLDYKYQYPSFNIADSAICVGVALMALDIGFHREKENASTSV